MKIVYATKKIIGGALFEKIAD